MPIPNNHEIFSSETVWSQKTIYRFIQMTNLSLNFWFLAETSLHKSVQQSWPAECERRLGRVSVAVHVGAGGQPLSRRQCQKEQVLVLQKEKEGT